MKVPLICLEKAWGKPKLSYALIEPTQRDVGFLTLVQSNRCCAFPSGQVIRLQLGPLPSHLLSGFLVRAAPVARPHRGQSSKGCHIK